MKTRPVIHLEKENPLIFNHVEELGEIRRLREVRSSFPSLTP
jgi:hypothetical protein